MKYTRHNRGFTLIELVIVVVILALLSAIGAYTYNQITNSAKTNSMEATVKAFAKSYNSSRAIGMDIDQSFNTAVGDTNKAVTNTSVGRVAYAKYDRINLVANPSLETNAVGWGVESDVSIQRSANPAMTGNYLTYVTLTTAGSRGVRTDVQGIEGGRYYIASADVRKSGTTTDTTRTAIMYLRYVNASGQYIETTASSSNQPIMTNFTQTISVGALAPEGAVTARIFIRFNGAAGERFIFDAVKFERATNSTEPLQPYFDGDTPNASWSGAAHASSSIMSLPTPTPGMIAITHQDETWCYAPPKQGEYTMGPKLYTGNGQLPFGHYKTSNC